MFTKSQQHLLSCFMSIENPTLSKLAEAYFDGKMCNPDKRKREKTISVHLCKLRKILSQNNVSLSRANPGYHEIHLDRPERVRELLEC